MAKDEDYTAAVTKAWGDEIAARTKQTSDSDSLLSSLSSSVASPFTYECKTDGSLLYGHVYRPSPPSPPPSDPSASADVDAGSRAVSHRSRTPGRLPPMEGRLPCHRPRNLRRKRVRRPRRRHTWRSHRMGVERRSKTIPKGPIVRARPT